MPRFITIKVDIDDIARLVENSAHICLRARGVAISDDYLKEVGNNVAAGIILAGDLEHTEDRLELWAHIVSAHCNIMPTNASVAEMLDYHDHEHRGPGTIRNHPENSRHHSLAKIAKVLSESEPEDE